MLTYQDAKNLIVYDPETGDFFREFTRKKIENRKIKKGKEREIRVSNGQYIAADIAWLLMCGRLSELPVTYADGDVSNLKWDNIKQGTPGDQTAVPRQAKIPDKAYVCEHRGVRYMRGRYRWNAKILRDNEILNLGYFKAEDEAITARILAENDFPPIITNPPFIDDFDLLEYDPETGYVSRDHTLWNSDLRLFMRGSGAFVDYVIWDGMTGNMPKRPLIHLTGSGDFRWGTLYETEVPDVSGARGVYWIESRRRWKARILDRNNKPVYLGEYRERTPAVEARWQAEGRPAGPTERFLTALKGAYK